MHDSSCRTSKRGQVGSWGRDGVWGHVAGKRRNWEGFKIPAWEDTCVQRGQWWQLQHSCMPTNGNHVKVWRIKWRDVCVFSGNNTFHLLNFVVTLLQTPTSCQFSHFQENKTLFPLLNFLVTVSAQTFNDFLEMNSAITSLRNNLLLQLCSHSKALSILFVPDPQCATESRHCPC